MGMSLGFWMARKLPMWLNLSLVLGVWLIVWLFVVTAVRLRFEDAEFYSRLASTGSAATGVITHSGSTKLPAEYDFTITDAAGNPVTIHALEFTDIDQFGLKPG